MSTVGTSWPARLRVVLLGPRQAMLTLVILACAAAACAQEEGSSVLSGGVETETNSRYVWRGLAWSEGAVQQTSLYASVAGLSGSVWLNHDLNSPGGHLGLNEVDVAVSYAWSLGALGVEPSFSHYRYPYQTDSPATDELGVLLNYDLGRFSLRSEQSLDIQSYPGAYYGDIGLASERELSQRISLEATAYFGWASTELAAAYVGEVTQPFRVAGFSGRMYYQPARWIYLSPHVSYSAILPSGYGEWLESTDLWQVGLALNTEFLP